VTQRTRVFQIDASVARRLENDLRARLPDHAQWRPLPHARFSVRVEDLVLTCYQSGKLVVQGRNPQPFIDEFLAGLAAGGDPRPAPAIAGALIGSDETGKGDYFGPLVVAAAFVGEGDREWVERLGVADSKTLSDERMRRMIGALERLDHEIVSLAPQEYNRRYAAMPNVNRLLAVLHAQALAPLVARHPGTCVLVDRFASDGALLEDALGERAAVLPVLMQRTKAESELAVGAASILARVAFLEGLEECSRACGTDLAKGAGPRVDAAARRVVEIGGRDLLGKVAKLHFRNTAKIPGAGSR
jgi:ribonuclease HIII